MTTFIVMTNTKGRTFAALLIRQGDQYGRNGRLTNRSGRPMVEFWDLTYRHELISQNMLDEDYRVYGQFVSRYHLDSLLDRDRFADLKPGESSGLCLDTANRAVWTIDAGTLDAMLAFLDDQASKAVTTNA